MFKSLPLSTIACMVDVFPYDKLNSNYLEIRDTNNFYD